MREIKAKIILLRVPVSKIGLLTALIDGSGRNAIVRTKERKKNEVYVITTPHTYKKTMEVLGYVKKHLPELEVLGDINSEDMDIGV